MPLGLASQSERVKELGLLSALGSALARPLGLGLASEWGRATVKGSVSRWERVKETETVKVKQLGTVLLLALGSGLARPLGSGLASQSERATETGTVKQLGTVLLLALGSELARPLGWGLASQLGRATEKGSASLWETVKESVPVSV
jgi:hypothetical protein